MTAHSIQDLIFHIIVACSVAHSLLPPWDFLDQFPTAQKYYKVFIYVIGYVALNGRSTVYRSISTASTNGKANGGTPPAAPPAPPAMPAKP
jgi:hypothetical protein